MFREQFVGAGRRPESAEALASDALARSLLRLTLGALEIVSTRREVLESGSEPQVPYLPFGLDGYRKAIYENAVVFEFSQLAREYFATRGGTPVWERPVWGPGEGSESRQAIDFTVFHEDKPEIRVEFGISASTPGSRQDAKLASDALKLYRLRDSHTTDAFDAAHQPLDAAEAERGRPQNYIVLWQERRGGVAEKLTHGSYDRWKNDCIARAAAGSVVGQFQILTHRVAASELMTPARGVHRSAYAAIFVVKDV